MTAASLEELGNVFADALCEIVLKFTDISLKVLSSEPDDSFYGLTGIMNLAGTHGGAVFVSADEEDLRLFCSRMTGTPKESVRQDDMYDAVCELVNMTAGSASPLVGSAGHSYSLTTPVALSGENMRLTAKGRTRVISRLLGDGEISLKLKVILAG